MKPFEKAAQDAEKEVTDAKAEVRAVKAEMAKEKPDVMQFFQAEEDIEAERAKLKKERRELEQRVSEVEDDIEAARTSKHEKSVREAAKEAGVDADLMLTIFPKPVEGVDLKAIASKLPKVKAKEEEEGSEGDESSITANPWAGWNPDSGLSSGGEGEATEERLTKTANKGDMKAYAKLRGHEKLVTKE